MPPSKATLKRRARRRKARCQNLVDHVYKQLWNAAQACHDENRVRCQYDQWGGGTWSVCDQFQCGNHVHYIEVTYVRNPRDVNLLCCTIDGEFWQTML